MPLRRILLAAFAVALIAAPAPAHAGGPPPHRVFAAEPTATEHDLCRAEGARPAPGPPTWWPSPSRCLLAAAHAPDAVFTDVLEPRIVLGVVLALAAVAGMAGRIRRRSDGGRAADDSAPGAA